MVHPRLAKDLNILASSACGKDVDTMLTSGLLDVNNHELTHQGCPRAQESGAQRICSMQSVGAAGGSPIHTARRHFRSCSDGVHGDIHTQLAQDLEHVRLLLAKSIGQVRDVLDGDDGLQLAQDGCGEDELGLVLVMCPVHFVLARCPIADR